MVGIGGVIAGVVGGTALTISAMAVPFLIPAFRRVCIPYVPASPQQLANVKKLIALCPPPVAPIIDLGSGDGRIVSLY